MPRRRCSPGERRSRVFPSPHPILLCIVSAPVDVQVRLRYYGESSRRLASRMVSAWRMSPATGENQGSFLTRTLASFMAAREVSTAIILVLGTPPIGELERKRRVGDILALTERLSDRC
jgi:hypothetical protein